jgi:calnexin
VQATEESNEEPEVEETYAPPSPSGAVFYETFVDGLTWTVTEDTDYEGTWRVGTIEGSVGITSETGLIVEEAAKKHGISKSFDSLLEFDKDVVIQYEVRLHDGLQCGGAYIKLLDTRQGFDAASFNGDTPYVIMFGPDHCGDNNKVHFIFNHQNPVTGEFEEKHMDKAPRIKNDRKTHVYTLIIRTDNSFEVLIDQESVRSGSLLEDVTPPVNPPAEIDDPEDIKPEDWVDDEMMKDPEASKPDDWDEDAPRKILDETDSKPEGWLDDGPFEIVDPESEMPEDWDEEDDGEWEPAMVPNPVCSSIGCGEWKQAMIDNPDYKGKWIHPMIPNPAYIGVWKARQIPNPAFFVDNEPHTMNPIGAVGIEIWTMQKNLEFDNIYLGHSVADARAFASQTWAIKKENEKTVEDLAAEAARGVTDDILDFLSENAIAVSVTAVAGFVVVIFLVNMGGSSNTPATPATPTSTGVSLGKEAEAAPEKADEKADEHQEEQVSRAEEIAELSGSEERDELTAEEMAELSDELTAEMADADADKLD